MTEIKSEFRTKLEEFKKEYEAERKGFNIFRALHKEHDEKYLHSRFISYLLSPTSKHGMGDLYLKLFIETLSTEYLDLCKFNIDNCTVRPNEEKKGEFKDIDILIRNDTQAIVIENKIFADDSIHDVTEEEKQSIEISAQENDNFNQNTSEKGKQHQLDTYCIIMGKEIGEKNVIAIYLTPYERDPSISIQHKPLINIYYHNEIIKWIDKCIQITDNGFLKEVLYQYKAVVRSFTSNLKRVGELKKLIGKNIEEAWKIKDYILEKEKNDDGEETKQIKWVDFKHVQWHTIDEFWIELVKRLKKELKVDISNEIDIKDITNVAHKGKGSIGINFKLNNGEEWYIVNDYINGLTYGKILEDMSQNRYEGKHWIKLSENIKFIDFNNYDTFMLINAEKREDKIKEIINRLKENPLLKEPISIIL